MPENEKKFLDYDLKKQLGVGAFGEVWLAKKADGKEYALKFLKILPDQKVHIDLFKQEFSLLSELRHAKLAHVYDFGLSPNKDQYYFTQEICPGKNFIDAVKDKPHDYFEKVIVQILSALDYVHAAGVVHFDIKADNILVSDEDGEPSVKILDFGVAAKLKSLPKMVGGTPTYMAPELISLSSKLDHRVDLYALGMLCLRSLTGKLPFGTKTLEEIKEWHLKGKIPEQIWEGVEAPRHLREMTEKLLEKNPAERFSNAQVALSFLNIATGKKYNKAAEETHVKIPEEGPLVGRAAILENLKAKFEDAISLKNIENKSICTMSGEQGIGKSRILDELRRISEVREVRCLSITCDHKEIVWTKISRWLEIGDMNLDQPDENWQARCRADAILQKAKKESLCILMDDFQFADRSSILLLEALSKMLKSEALFVLAATEQLTLGAQKIKRLSKANVSDYIKRVLGPIKQSVEVSKLLHEYSGGLPLLMVEGLKFIAPKIVQGEPIKDMLPSTEIGSLYKDKIKTLKKTELSFLQTIALLRHSAKLDELEAILKLHSGKILELASACRKQGLLKDVFSNLADNQTLEITNQALAMNMISSLDSKVQQRFDKNIALGLESLDNVNKSEVAFHFTKAGDLKNGMKYYLAAAEDLKKSKQFYSASTMYQRALPLAKEGSTIHRSIQIELVNLLTLTANYKEAKEHLDALKGKTTFESEKLAGWLAFKQRDFDTARESYERALGLLPKKNSVERISLKNGLGNIALQAGQVNDASARFSEALDLEKTFSDEQRSKIDNNNLGLALSIQGRPKEAIEFYEDRLRRLSPEQSKEKISILNGFGYVYINSSQFEKAAEYLVQARELAEKTGARNALFSILGNLITAYIKEGKYAESLEQLSEMVSLQERLGSARDLAYNLLRLGDAHLILGMEEAAKDSLSKGLSQALAIGDESLATWFLLMQGYKEKEFGDANKAKSQFAQVKAQANAIPDAALVAWAQYALAETSADQEAWEECKRLLSEIGENPNDEEFIVRRRLLELRASRGRSPCLPDKLGHPQGGAPTFQELEEACIKNHFHEILWEVYYAWGQDFQKKGKKEEAIALFEKGVGILRAISLDLPEEYRDRYLKHRARQKLYKDWKKLTTREETWPEAFTPKWGEIPTENSTESTVAFKPK